jgi:hypothetical protein
MGIKVASKLHFGCFIYAQKDNEITFLMQLISYRNSSGINGNYQNNILTIVTANDDIIMPMAIVVACYAIAGLVPPHSSKLRLTNLKTEAH